MSVCRHVCCGTHVETLEGNFVQSCLSIHLWRSGDLAQIVRLVQPPPLPTEPSYRPLVLVLLLLLVWFGLAFFFNLITLLYMGRFFHLKTQFISWQKNVIPVIWKSWSNQDGLLATIQPSHVKRIMFYLFTILTWPFKEMSSQYHCSYNSADPILRTARLRFLSF